MRFEDLEVWQRAAGLSATLYRSTSSLKDFGFRDQVTRAGLSIASNIAEGYERDSSRDRVKFLSYAKGSCAELRAQILIGIEAGLIPRQTGERWTEETRHISRMLHGLMEYMSRHSG